MEISNLAEQPADIDIQNFGQRLELDVRYRAFLSFKEREGRVADFHTGDLQMCEQVFCSRPAVERASVTRESTILRLTGAGFRVFILITNFFACFSIRNFVVAKFGSSKYNEI